MKPISPETLEAVLKPQTVEAILKPLIDRGRVYIRCTYNPYECNIETDDYRCFKSAELLLKVTEQVNAVSVAETIDLIMFCYGVELCEGIVAPPTELYRRQACTFRLYAIKLPLSNVLTFVAYVNYYEVGTFDEVELAVFSSLERAIAWLMGEIRSYKSYLKDEWEEIATAYGIKDKRVYKEIEERVGEMDGMLEELSELCKKVKIIKAVS